MITQFVTQELVDAIVRRARDSDLGLGAGLTHKQGHLQIAQYGGLHNLKTLALLLVDGFDQKYDLASVFGAALEVVTEKTSVIIYIEDSDRERYTSVACQMSILWEPLGPVGNGRLKANRFTASPSDLFEFGRRVSPAGAIIRSETDLLASITALLLVPEVRTAAVNWASGELIRVRDAQANAVARQKQSTS